MDKSYIEQNAIDTKYLRNQLTPEQTEEFEVYLLDHPEMLEQIELDAVLGSELPNVTLPTVKPFSLSAWFAPASLATGFALATISFSVFTVSLMADRGLSASPSLFVDITRNISDIDTVSTFEFDSRNFTFLGSLRSDRFVLSLDTSSMATGQYRATIEKQQAAENQASPNVELVAEAAVNVAQFQPMTFALNASSYPPGLYKILLDQPSLDDNKVREFYFRTKIK